MKLCLKSGSPPDTEAFVHVTQSIIETAIGRALRQWNVFGSGIAEDLVQEVYVILCEGGYAVLRRFLSDRPEALVAYLKTIAASVAVDHLRTISTQKRGQGRTAESIDDVQNLVSAADSEESLQRGILLEQVDNCLKSNGEVAGRDRRIFWMYYRQGLSSRAISGFAAVGLTQKGVESAIHRMIRVVRHCLDVAERKTAPISVKEGRRAGG